MKLCSLLNLNFCQNVKESPRVLYEYPPSPENHSIECEETTSAVEKWKNMTQENKQKLYRQLEVFVNSFAKEFAKGKVITKLGQNGNLFTRLCSLDKRLSSFSIQVKGAIIEYPFEDVQHIAFGYELIGYKKTPINLPDSSLAAFIQMKGQTPLNLIFQTLSERDEFVTCMLVLRDRWIRKNGKNRNYSITSNTVSTKSSDKQKVGFFEIFSQRIQNKLPATSKSSRKPKIESSKKLNPSHHVEIL
eukprot:GHVL01005171.1.p1 GENE.GHVL01005171.1~~GHVL01005171.1.p1  ORF type:complete len:246 (+),score=46.04 GHVL01005171.1:50-787(+)